MRSVPAPEQKEKARHGEQMFPLKQYITGLSAEHPAIPAHWHDEAEWTMILEGSCRYQIQLETYDVSAGDLVFIPPAALHAISWSGDASMRSETYVFHMDFLGAHTGDICAVRYLSPAVSRNLQFPLVLSAGHPAYGEAVRIFRFLSQAYTEQTPGFELTLKACLLQFLAILVPHASLRQQDLPRRDFLRQEHTARLKRVLEYMDSHISEDLPIEDLARVCGFSPWYFMRFFKTCMGMTCLEYIKKQRLEKAAGLLVQEGMTPLEASLSAGFSNLSYFYREFRKAYGMTPSQYRRIRNSS